MKNYKKKTEKLLYRYPLIKDGLKNMRFELMDIYNSISLSSADPGAENFVTNKFNSSVENSVIKRNESKRIKTLKYNIEKNESVISSIENAISMLEESEAKIIEEFYFEGKKWFEVVNNSKYSERWCKTIKFKALEKIALSLGYVSVNELEE